MNASKKNDLSPAERRREREKKNRRLDIIKAAENLFLSQTFENTSMEQIANAALYGKGTLYNYFKSKDDLYLAIGSKAYSILINDTKKFIRKQKPGIAQLIAVGRAYYGFTQKYPNYANIFHEIGIKYPNVNKKQESELTSSEREYIRFGNSYRDIFLDVISNAIKLKAIRTDISPIMIGVGLSSLTSGLIKELIQRKSFLEELGINMDQIVDFVFNMIGEGLEPREKRQKV